MSTPAQPNPPPAGDQPANSGDASAVMPFDEKLHQFWVEKRGIIFALCAAILVVILGRYGWEWIQERRQAARAEAYQAAVSDADLRKFAAEHAETTLGGVALLRVADNAYQDGRWSEALTAYQQARAPLAETAFADRVRLGIAVTTLKNGDATNGRNALQEIADDAGVEKALRAEAAYHLATIAAEAGNAEEVARLTGLVSAIDPTGLWAQRATMLRANLPVPAAAVAPEPTGAPTISFPTGGR